MMKRLGLATLAACVAFTLLWALNWDDATAASTHKSSWAPRSTITSSNRVSAGAAHSTLVRVGGPAARGTPAVATEAGGAAVGAFLQAFWTRDLEREKRFPRSNEARDALHPFYPDTSDASPANIALIEQRAREGSDLALGAFLLVAAGTVDYTAKAQELLLLNAANGSVLALTTLAGYASSGYGFGQSDSEAAIVFEYLAWRTGMWNNASLAFVPSLVDEWTTSECFSALEVADRLVTNSEMFPGATDVRERNCVKAES